MMSAYYQDYGFNLIRGFVRECTETAQHIKGQETSGIQWDVNNSESSAGITIMNATTPCCVTIPWGVCPDMHVNTQKCDEQVDRADWWSEQPFHMSSSIQLLCQEFSYKKIHFIRQQHDYPVLCIIIWKWFKKPGTFQRVCLHNLGRSKFPCTGIWQRINSGLWSRSKNRPPFLTCVLLAPTKIQVNLSGGSRLVEWISLVSSEKPDSSIHY